MHQQRLDYAAAAPDAFRAQLALSETVKRSALGKQLIELVFMRVSQINACAFCLDMHGAALRAAGESPARLDMLAAWREAPVFSERERAALGFAEALTRLGDGGVSDADYEAARAQFGEEEIANLAFAVVAINSWNRLAISFRATPLSARKANAA
jgi:AhpD family alkylhydroperoxidase